MIEEGSTHTDYEPYTGGEPSPSPDFPQPINNLSGDVPYKVSGKNKLNTSTIEIGTKNGVTCSYNNETQEITFNGTCTANNTRFSILNNSIPFTINTTTICAYLTNEGNNTGNGLFRVFADNYDTYDYLNLTTLTSTNRMISKKTSATITKTIFDFRFDNGAVLDNFKIKLMITDSEDTTYEPYIEPQTFNIPLGDIELCKIDTYEDKIYSSDGRFYLEKNCGSNIFDNDTNVYAVNNTASGASNISLNGTYNILKSILNANIKNDTMYCSIAKYEYNSTIKDNMSAQTNLNDNTMCMRQGTNDRIYFKNSVFTGKTGTEIKELIEGEKLYYVSITPTTTEITQENYPSLYNALKQIQDYLTAYKINKEFILGYSSPEIEY